MLFRSIGDRLISKDVNTIEVAMKERACSYTVIVGYANTIDMSLVDAVDIQFLYIRNE